MKHTAPVVFAAVVLAAITAGGPSYGQEGPAPGEPVPAPAGLSPLQMMRNPLGERIPDVVLVDDAGREVRFFTDLVKDRAVVISFFYTTCRGTCPGTNLVLSDLREILAADFGRSLRLISISVEPERDDVPAIAEYAAQFRREATDVDTPEWVFLTGEPDAIRDLRRRLDYYDIDEAVDRDPTKHAAAVIVGNQATGRWGMMPVGLGAKRMANNVRALAGWTAAQRYAVDERLAAIARGGDGAPDGSDGDGTSVEAPPSDVTVATKAE